ncbi:APC family permease [Agromyces indicus]|uniref:APC family permease n=1 Tax=Agromyces indicus TaxID=758919 RepID=A0ABU1FJ18_9MICO|nr:APC family permease [Agromyces indicus]MDR5691391.1 APC family permease [Agromyces indicus]
MSAPSTSSASAPPASGAAHPSARRLLPRLGLAGLIFFGLAYMAPGIVTSTFGVVSAESGGVAPTAYLVATIAMGLTAVSYAVLARNYPTAGSSYSYVGKILGRHLGFFAGWVILLDYLFLPMVAWLIQSIYLNAQFPGIPLWGWVLINIVPTTIINLLGITLADRVNKWFTIVALGSVAVTAVVIVGYLVSGSAPAVEPGEAFWNGDTSVLAIGAAAAVAAYSFLGFDAVSTLSEEARDARRNIPRAILLVVLIGGGIFVLMSFLMQRMHPGGDFDNPDIAGYTLQVIAGGETFANINNLIAVIAAFGSGLAIQATSSRLLFVIGRDGVLPRTVFGRLNMFRVPWVNILIIAGIGLIGMLLDIAQATALINFGAFLAFALVNLSFLVWIWRTRDRRSSVASSLLSLVPAVGVAVDLFLFSQLHDIAFVLGGAWLALGVVVLAFATRWFRRPVPSLDQELADEAVDLPEGVKTAP